jgi:hypothetical protein
VSVGRSRSSASSEKVSGRAPRCSRVRPFLQPPADGRQGVVPFADEAVVLVLVAPQDGAQCVLHVGDEELLLLRRSQLPPVAIEERIDEVGFSPMQIIPFVTANAAAVCRLSDTLGTLEPGKQADILVVNGDPLADLEALTSTVLVIHRGTIIVDHR